MDRGERGARIREAILVPFEVEARLDAPRGAAVERQHIARYPVLAELLCNGERLLRGLVVRARHPQPEAPARDRGRTSGQRGVRVENAGGRGRGEYEKIERFVV